MLPSISAHAVFDASDAPDITGSRHSPDPRDPRYLRHLRWIQDSYFSHRDNDLQIGIQTDTPAIITRWFADLRAELDSQWLRASDLKLMLCMIGGNTWIVEHAMRHGSPRSTEAVITGLCDLIAAQHLDGEWLVDWLFEDFSIKHHIEGHHDAGHIEALSDGLLAGIARGVLEADDWHDVFIHCSHRHAPLMLLALRAERPDIVDALDRCARRMAETPWGDIGCLMSMWLLNVSAKSAGQLANLSESSRRSGRTNAALQTYEQRLPAIRRELLTHLPSVGGVPFERRALGLRLPGHLPERRRPPDANGLMGLALPYRQHPGSRGARPSAEARSPASSDSPSSWARPSSFTGASARR